MISEGRRGGGAKAYSAIIKYMKKNPILDPRYSGCLPNSSLNDEEIRGITPNPKAYMLSPIVAWKREQFKSRIIEVNPVLYVEAAAAVR